VIRLLKEKIPIERAQMRLKLSIPVKDAKRIKEQLDKLIATTEKEEWGNDVFLCVSVFIC
jgi:ribosome maturation protein SDO1